MRWESQKDIELQALVALYDSVGWTAYTKDPESLGAMVRCSTFVQSCWDEGQLVGLVRVISDDLSIMYLQDILMHPDFHRRGIGRALMERCLERFEHVRQKVLLTDDRPEQSAFYESLGFRNTRDLETTKLNAFVRIEGANLS